MAGLFNSWTISVTPGLAKLEDENYLKAMQALNKAILNPGFFVIFIGSIILLPLCTYLQYKQALDQRSYFLLGATGVYLTGSVLVTFLGNVPINNQLEALNLNGMNAEALHTFREGFETKWNRLNLIRTLSSLIALGLVIYPLVFKSES